MPEEMPTPRYKRIVLKLSGESLRERGAKENISPQIVREIAERIRDVRALGVQTSVVGWIAPRLITWECWQR
jgi:uridylate kinase